MMDEHIIVSMVGDSVLKSRRCIMKIRFTPFTDRWRLRNELADTLHAHAVECHEIAERNCDLIKEQYEALARQWLIITAQRTRTV
jgi:hypothetical protein